MATIADKLTYLNETKTAIKNAIVSKGVAIEDTDTFRSYADKIGQISGGGAPTTKFGASIDMFVGYVDENGVLQAPTIQTALNFTGVTEIDSNALRDAFFRRPGLTSVDLSSVQTVGDYGMYYAFYGCSDITGALVLSSLQSVGNYGLANAFSGCVSLTSVDLSSLTTVGEYGMYSAFFGCSGLTTISFPSLTSVQTNSLINTFGGYTNLTEIHFRADMQATIEAMDGYSNKWGATNATAIFDLL